MQYEVVFAGFGGQGVLAIGQILAMAGMEAGEHVVWIPSYGPEMRGGTANCTVVLSDRPIGSPIVNNPTCAAVMNRPSLEKFGPKLKEKGLLIVNSSLIDIRSGRNDIDQILLPANQMAIDAGAPRAANMAMLGAFVGRTRILPTGVVRRALEARFASKKEVFEVNLKVFEKGYEEAAKGPAWTPRAASATA